MAEEQRKYHYTEGKTKGAKTFSTWAMGAKADQLTLDQLKDAYDNDPLLQETFESWDNYLGYMDDRQDLIDSGEYNPDWYEDQSVSANDPVFTLADGTTVAGSAWTPEMGDPVSVSGISGATGGGTNEQAILTNKQWSVGSEKLKGIFDQYATGVNNAEFGEWGHRSEGNDGYTWNGTDWVKTWEPKSAEGLLFKTAIGIGAGLISGVGISQALNAATTAGNALASSIATSLKVAPSTISAAAGGMAGSAVSQSVLTGSVDPTKLVQAGLTAGILDAASILQGANEVVDGSNIDDLLNVLSSDNLSKLDQTINSIADVLGTGYDAALEIAKGVAIGVINEGDLQGIAINAASTLGADKIVNYIDDNIGFALPNLFQEGTTDISPDAVEEVSRVFLKDVLSGDLSPETLLDAGIGYVRNDGSLAPIDPGILEGLRDKLPEASFSDLLPDFELVSGEDFGIDFVKGEDRPFDAEDPFAKANDEDPSDVIQFKYDQGVVDAVTGAIENVRETGREIDDEVLQPVKEALEAGGRAVDDTVLQPVKEFIEAGGRAIDDTVLQPVKEFIEEILPESPKSPEGIEGTGGSGIDLDVDLKKPEFKGSKPFGEGLKQMAPLSAPRLAPGVEIFGKAQVNAPYDPTRAGSPITAGLFSEYIG